MSDSRSSETDEDGEPLVVLARDSDAPASDELDAPFIEPTAPSAAAEHQKTVEKTEDGSEPFVQNIAPTSEEPPQRFLCGTCGGSFAAERVYDAGGSYICTECFMRQPPPPAAGSNPAAAIPHAKPKRAVPASTSDNGSVAEEAPRRTAAADHLSALLAPISVGPDSLGVAPRRSAWGSCSRIGRRVAIPPQPVQCRWRCRRRARHAVSHARLSALSSADPAHAPGE